LSIDWQVEGQSLVVSARAEGVPAAGADVETRSDADVILATGLLDAQGQWRCPLSSTGGMTIVVNAGLGHRRVLRLTHEELRRVNAPAASGSTSINAGSDPGSARAPHPSGSTENASGQTVRVLAGVAFILALSAAWLSYRNSRRLSALEKRLEQNESRG
jgi:hypothetical protein